MVASFSLAFHSTNHPTPAISTPASRLKTRLNLPKPSDCTRFFATPMLVPATAMSRQWPTAYARYTRRGGLDIDPFRSNFEPAPENGRLARQ